MILVFKNHKHCTVHFHLSTNYFINSWWTNHTISFKNSKNTRSPRQKFMRHYWILFQLCDLIAQYFFFILCTNIKKAKLHIRNSKFFILPLSLTWIYAQYLTCAEEWLWNKEKQLLVQLGIQEQYAGIQIIDLNRTIGLRQKHNK